VSLPQIEVNIIYLFIYLSIFRAAEMDYYVEAFSSFGTQAALIAGFTLDALIGLDVRSYSVDETWKAVFWISASVSMAASLHCVLTTTFANIYGPNLALRGPSG
jgi:1-aminocyclopropane-1-carboxylate deaminase/D-cysteine desulfhydrase-like pyridoxal-dependent ACC family enzyme